MVFVRRDIWNLERPQPWHPITLAYARAVRALQEDGPPDVSRWEYLAAMHGTTCKPDRPLWNECRHRSWHFLPWHRWYLYYFEAAVRKIVVAQGGPSDWALPYWDYGRVGDSDSIPIAFREATMPDGSDNPLFVQQRAPGINDGLRLDPRITSPTPAAMATANFTPPPRPGFGGGVTDDVHFWRETGLLEGTPHNAVHGGVGGEFGGWMADASLAALDPIFWLHHANVDRIWAVWSGSHANPADPAWLGKTFSFLDADGGTVTRSIADALDTVGQLDYTYDPAPEAAISPQPGPTQGGPEAMPEMLGASDHGLTLRGAREEVEITLDRTILAAPESLESRRVYLAVEHLDADRPPGKVYAVYVDAPGAERPREHVGNVTLFDAGRSQRRGPQDEGRHDDRVVFDISDLVAAIDAAAEHQSVRVSFEPIGLLNDSGATVESVASGQSPPLRIGQVTVFAE